MQWDRRMSDAEGLMWRLEKDPHLSSTFGNLTLLDRRPDVARLKRRMERAVLTIPRLGQRVQSAPANLTPPTWVDDPGFDIHHHVRHISLPKPGSLRQLLDLVALIVADPFDRTRPLWQFWVIDGLAKGRSALVQKLHHTITDGEGGVRLSLEFLDFAADAPEPADLDPETLAALREPPPAGGDLLHDLVSGSLRLPLGLVQQIRDVLSDPTQLPSVGMAAVESVTSVVSQLTDTDRARSPLWTQRSLRRRFDVLRIPLEPTRAAARRLGGTLNTAFVAGAAHAAGAYHDRLGSPVDELRTSIAISTRTAQSSGNAFSLSRLLVPTSPMPIAERFVRIHEAAASAKSAAAGGASLDALAGLTASLPTALLTRIGRQQAQTVDFATSNVRASPIPLFVAGAQVLENYPVGPIAGTAFNLTLMSYCGSLDVGVHTDSAAVDDSTLLIDSLKESFAQFTG